MSPGPAEEAGKVATSAIDALKQAPGLLAVIILQVIILTVLYFIHQNNSDHQHAREIMLIERCLPPSGEA